MNNIQMDVEMTKAILDGRKVQTRRVITQELKQPIDLKFPENEMYLDSYNSTNKWYWWTKDGRQNLAKCIKAKYKKSETIWVREPAKISKFFKKEKSLIFTYISDKKSYPLNIPKRFTNSKWIENCQGIPNGCIKEMARIFLKITNVRVERLRDISYKDLRAEGIWHKSYCSTQTVSSQRWETWINLWNKTAPKGYKWEDNPYIFVYEFEIVGSKEN